MYFFLNMMILNSHYLDTFFLITHKINTLFTVSYVSAENSFNNKHSSSNNRSTSEMSIFLIIKQIKCVRYNTLASCAHINE